MTPRRSARRTTRVLTPLAAATAVLVLGGCGQLTNPIQTDFGYQAADGVPVDMGSVQIRGLVVVADSADGPGVVVGNLLNRGGSDEQVTVITADGDTVEVDAKAYSSTSLSSTDQVTLTKVGVAPGGVVTLSIGTRQSGANQVVVPVLPAREYYAPYTPTSAPTTPSED